MRRLRSLVSIVAIGIAASCATTDDLSLLQAGDPDDPRYADLRSRLDITYEVTFEGSIPGCSVGSCTPAQFLTAVTAGCVFTSSLPREDQFACALPVITVERNVCEAETLLRLAATLSGETVTVSTAGATAHLPPQDAETNSELARLAAEEAARAMRIAGDTLMNATACTEVELIKQAGKSGPAALTGTTVGAELVGFFREAFHLISDATEVYGQAAAAVSDAERARAVDAAEAEVIELAPWASRAAAAHRLVGGASGLPGLTGVATNGFFPRDRLSPEGQLALQYLRTAALNPADLASTSYTMDQLVGGIGGAPTFGSDHLRVRLGFFLPQDDLFTATPDEFYQRLGVSRTAFAEARDYLRAERLAFDRSPTRQLPPERLPDGQMTNSASGYNMVLYAATRNEPSEPLPAWWSAILRFDDTPRTIVGSYGSGTTGPAWGGWITDSADRIGQGGTWGTESGGTTASTVTGDRTMLSLVQEAADRAQAITTRLSSIATTDAVRAMRDTMAAMSGGELGGSVSPTGIPNQAYADGASPSPIGRARACFITPSTGNVSVRLDVQVPSIASSSLVVINSHEGLDCAVTGMIEGAPCGPADLSVVSATWSNSIAGVPQIYSTTINTTLASHTAQTRPVASSAQYFVLRRKPGYTTNHPGGLEVVAAFVLPAAAYTAGSYSYCTQYALMPSLERTASELIAPSTEYPGESAQSCAGVPTDLRLPLENELTEDGSGVESSWRHYLDIAAQAAAEADALGETVVEEGLQMDLRAESAADELQRICGFSLNVSPFSRIQSTMPASGTSCTTAGYVYRAGSPGICVIDPVAYLMANPGMLGDVDRDQLASCLGTFEENANFVALGDAPLCMWRVTGQADHTICQGRDSQHPCPYLATTTLSGWPPVASWGCPNAYPAGSYTTMGPFTDTLDLFTMPETPQGDDLERSEFPCEQLARLRLGVETDEEFRQIEESGFMHFRQFHDTAEQLRWEAIAGDHSRVTFGNSTVFATGRPDTAPAEWLRWPLGPAPAGLCPGGVTTPSVYSTYTGPLFCIQNDRAAAETSGNGYAFSVRDRRARLNDMLARAVIAARVLGGNDLTGLQVPFYPRTSAATFALGTGGQAPTWQPIGSSLFEAQSGTFAIDHSGSDLAEANINTYEGRLLRFDGTSTGACATLDSAAGAEWIQHPYDADGAGSFRVYDDAADCDDGSYPYTGGASERDLPLLVRQLPSKMARGGAQRIATILWGENPTRSRETSFLWSTLIGRARPRTTAATTGTLDTRVSHSIDGQDLSNLSGYFVRDRALPHGFHEYSANVSNEGDDQDLRGTADGNIAQIAPFGLSHRDYWNGIELLCASARDAEPDAVTYGCAQQPTMATVNDMLRGSGYLDCIADGVAEQTARSVIRGLPAAVVAAVRNGGPSTYGTQPGESGAQIDEISAALIDIQTAELAIADDIRVFANELRSLRSTVRQSDLQQQVEDWQLAATVANQITTCITSVAQAAQLDPAKAAGSATAAAATCANGVFQTVAATRMREIRGEIGALEIEQAFARADSAFVSASRSVRERAAAVRSALSRIDAAVTRLKSLQASGRSALARALFLDSAATGAEGETGHFAVDTLMRRRYNTTLFRYRAAHQRAVRLAYIARLALEQRLAVRLDELTEDLVSVDAPASWADELCTMPSIDYERIRDSGHTDIDAPAGYSGSYVGDYVRNLQQVFESYNFAYPFEEGTDTAVISLRDDIFQTRGMCEVETPNLLAESGNLHVRAYEGRRGWAEVGCDEANGIDACVTARQIDAPDVDSLQLDECASGPVAYREPENVNSLDFGRAVGYRVTFGKLGEAARLSQAVALAPGRYRLSYYAKWSPVVDETLRIKPDSAVSVMSADAGALDWLSQPYDGARADCESGWTRFDAFFDVTRATDVEVAIVPVADGWYPGLTIDVAGIQLERAGSVWEGSITRTVDGEPAYRALGPGPFYATDEDGLREMPVCVDSDGEDFRARAWTRGCVRVCRDGYDGSCPDSAAGRRCYYETSFNVGSDSLQRLLTGTPTGFASGNFNYRFESVGVNLVGVGLRDCSLEGSTDGCYGSGNVSISLLHHGPFLVRNTFGGVYEAPLFPGRVESARALMAERYITNPISSADQALIQDYIRPELQGRPLGGSLAVRIWDDSGFVFERLEDVQIVMRYRYWQHQR